MVQRFRLIVLMVLSILVLMIIGAASLTPANAVLAATLNVSPNPAFAGQSVTFSGRFIPATGADNIQVVVTLGGICAVDDAKFIQLALDFSPSTLPTSTFSGTAHSDGTFSITVPGGFSAGSYTAQAQDNSYTRSTLSTCDAFTVGAPIPEYPFGLAVLAVLMIIGYGVIRRRVTNPDSERFKNS
jgi:hypothetical protein